MTISFAPPRDDEDFDKAGAFSVPSKLATTDWYDGRQTLPSLTTDAMWVSKFSGLQAAIDAALRLHEIPAKYVGRRTAPTRSDKDVASEFEELRHVWLQATATESIGARIVGHPAYLRLIGLGPQAVPLMLHDLKINKSSWFPALVAIVGVDVAEGIETAKEARQAWIKWGVTNGYIGA